MARNARLFLSVFVLIFSGLSHGETEPVVVTATRTAQTVDASLAAVSVIDRKEIEVLQPVTVSDILRTVPGLTVSNTGGLGQPSAVFLRGSESDHVLVLIDGIKVGSTTLGTTSFQFIDPDQIERIEVVRGPRSSLYGPDAIGGVIQIFTRNPDTAPRSSAFATVGTDDYSKFGARLSAGEHATKFSIGANYEKSTGYDVCAGSITAGCFTFEDDRDGYESFSVQAKLAGSMNEKTDFSVSYLSSTGETEYDGSFSNETDFSVGILGAEVSVNASDRLGMKFSVGQSQDDSDTLKNGTKTDHFDTTRTSLSWLNEFALSSQNIAMVGIDFAGDEVDSGTAYTETSRDNLGVFGQFIGSVGMLDVQSALRYDDNQQFGDSVTGDASIGYDLNMASRLTAQYGTAFKAPTFNELYYPGFGNANLDPEESATVEAGFRWQDANSRFSANIFSSEVDNLIAYDAALGAPGNVNKAAIQGVEFQIDTMVENWKVGSALTLLSAEQDGGTYDGKELPRRPGEFLELRLDRTFAKGSGGASLFSSGSTYDDLANTRVIDSYITVDLRGAYHLNANWHLVGKVSNLTDEDYEHASYYRQPGREFFIGVKWRH
ncbi:MAG TPA: TonB-dependent vitamin B12 receptor [Gammaproteobacteria bacterium]|nr:TonB-dependent vitamin B12 receptor [Gammaproteobacteria bacterium]